LQDLQDFITFVWTCKVNYEVHSQVTDIVFRSEENDVVIRGRAENENLKAWRPASMVFADSLSSSGLRREYGNINVP
jgi:hypothetical protein